MLCLSLVVIFASVVLYVLFDHRYTYYYARAVTFQVVDSKIDNNVVVCFVGDSWVERRNKKYNSRFSIGLGEKICKNVDLVISGGSGFSSKGIYENMFSRNNSRFAFNKKPDYCVIIAGINDADRKLGCSFYKHHMKLMLDCLLQEKIKPVVIEIPDFDINYSFAERNFEARFLDLCSMLYTRSKLDCIHQYRKSFQKLMDLELYNGQVIYIKSDMWNPKGYRDNRLLYEEDRMHLNSKGYQVLDSCIASVIAEDYNNTY